MRQIGRGQTKRFYLIIVNNNRFEFGYLHSYTSLLAQY